MTITEFFAKHSSGDLQKHAATLFIGKNYSPLFFDRALDFLKKDVAVGLADLELDLSIESSNSWSSKDIKNMNLDLDFSQISMTISTSFLGQTCIYWFGNI